MAVEVADDVLAFLRQRRSFLDEYLEVVNEKMGELRLSGCTYLADRTLAISRDLADVAWRRYLDVAQHTYGRCRVQSIVQHYFS